MPVIPILIAIAIKENIKKSVQELGGSVVSNFSDNDSTIKSYSDVAVKIVQIAADTNDYQNKSK